MGPGVRPAGHLGHHPGRLVLLKLRAGQLPRRPPRTDLRLDRGHRKTLAESGGVTDLLVSRTRRCRAGRIPLLSRHPPGRPARVALARGRPVRARPVLGRDPGVGARFLPPREHGPPLRPARGLGRHSRAPGIDVDVLRPRPGVQGGPGLHGGRNRPPHVRLWCAGGQEALALHPLSRRGMVPHRDRNRPAILSKLWLHGHRVLPLAGRAQPQHSRFAAGRRRGADPAGGALHRRRGHRLHVCAAPPGAPLAAACDPSLRRQCAQRAHPAEHPQSALRDAAAVPAHGCRGYRRPSIRPKSLDQARDGAGRCAACSAAWLGNRRRATCPPGMERRLLEAKRGCPAAGRGRCDSG